MGSLPRNNLDRILRYILQSILADVERILKSHSEVECLAVSPGLARDHIPHFENSLTVLVQVRHLVRTNADGVSRVVDQSLIDEFRQLPNARIDRREQLGPLASGCTRLGTSSSIALMWSKTFT